MTFVKERFAGEVFSLLRPAGLHGSEHYAVGQSGRIQRSRTPVTNRAGQGALPTRIWHSSSGAMYFAAL